MVAKGLMWFYLLVLMVSPFGCEPECVEKQGGSARISDLVKITPLKSNYKQGEKVVISCSLPSEVQFSSGSLDLYKETKDPAGTLISTVYKVIFDNEHCYVKGSKGENKGWFNMPYNREKGNYEFEVEVTLNKKGVYTLFGTGQKLNFEGVDNCNHYRIDTNISGWIEPSSYVEFVVE